MLVESMLEDMKLLSQSENLYSVSNIKIMRFVQAHIAETPFYMKKMCTI